MTGKLIMPCVDIYLLHLCFNTETITCSKCYIYSDIQLEIKSELYICKKFISVYNNKQKLI